MQSRLWGLLALVAVSCTSVTSSNPKGAPAAAEPAAQKNETNHEAGVRAKSALKSSDIASLETELFSPPTTKGSLFCGYYSSSCENGTSDSSIVLLSKTKDGYLLERFGHDAKSRENDPKEYSAHSVEKIPATFTSLEDKGEKLQFFSTCSASMKNNETCTLTLAQGHDRIFRGQCSLQGVREFYRPCSGEKLAPSGGIRKTKLTYGKKTFELPLLFQGAAPELPQSHVSAETFARVRSLIVGHRVGDLPPWAEPGSWDEGFYNFPPTEWSKSQMSVMAVTLPPHELAFYLLQPASHFEDLVVRDIVQAPAGATGIVDGRDCDQDGMIVGFTRGTDNGVSRNVDGLFMSSSKLVWKHDLKVFCH